MKDLKPGILFDLDGTLLDTAPEFTACLNALLLEAGKAPTTAQQLRSHVSWGVRGMLQFGFGPELTETELALYTEKFLTHYERHLGQSTQPFPGIPALLDWIQTHQIPWGIVTNKPSRFALPLLQRFPALCNSPCVISGDSLPLRKPDPAPLLAACTQLKLDPSTSWYVGDAMADLQASRQAGLRCAIAQYGYIANEIDLATWEADHLFQDPLALIPFWQQIWT